MYTIFINSKNSKTADSYRLVLNLTRKIVIDKERVINMLQYQILVSIIHGKR